MIRHKPLPPVARVLLALDYDPVSGIFTRRNGDKAGSLDRGYLRIRVDSVLYRAHRLAWLIVYGEEPAEIDHVNGKKDDNRIANLRIVTRSQNNWNRMQARRDNQTGFNGVRANKGRFMARITYEGKTRSLGSFATPEEAHAAYLQVRQRLLPLPV